MFTPSDLHNQVQIASCMAARMQHTGMHIGQGVGSRTHDRRQHLQAQAHGRADAVWHAHRRQLLPPLHQLRHQALVAALHKVLQLHDAFVKDSNY